LSAESCLPPLHVLFTHKRRMAALRMVCSPPTINPAAGRLCRTFPSLIKFRPLDSYRALCTRLDPNVMPLNWRTAQPSPPVRTHLPVDALAHLTLPLLENLSFAPLIRSSLLPDLPPLPPEQIMRSAYLALICKARAIMMDHWRTFQPTPTYYAFPLSLTPPPFMGLGKFMAGRIHQMRAQKSYLAAHPSWFNMDTSCICPLCGDEQETFSHAVLRCPAKEIPRSRHLQDVSSVDPGAPLWTTLSSLLALGAFIRATATNYPPDLLPSLPPSPASMVMPSSPAAAPLRGMFSSSPLRPV